MAARKRAGKKSYAWTKGARLAIDVVSVESAPKKPAVKVPSEELECLRLVDYLRARGLRFTHIPNSTNSKKQGVKNKRMGTSPGVPDYLILLPGGGGLWIEMKRRAGGRIAPEQKEWIAALQAAGMHAHVCAGFDAAKQTVETVLSKPGVDANGKRASWIIPLTRTEE